MREKFLIIRNQDDVCSCYYYFALVSTVLLYSILLIFCPGSRLDTYVEAEAFIESKQEGRLPFFREKPQFSAMQEGKDLELTCLAVGDPAPIVQWFK